MADDRTITDDERHDDDDKTWTGIIRRLGKVAKITGKAGNRPDRISTGFEPPPDDQKPGVLTALGDITIAAQAVLDKTAALQAIVRGGGTPGVDTGGG